VGHRIIAALVVTVAAVALARAEIIDRILAVVEGRVITLSDVRAVVALGLEPAPPAADPVGAMLDRQIERQLMLIEVDRYIPPEPRPEAIDERLAAIRQRFPDELAFQTTLHQAGMPIEQVRRYLRETLRIETYLRQRFSAGIQPAEEEVAAYYREHPAEFSRDGQVRPFEDVRALARERLVARRRDALIDEWLASLRRRVNIVRLYLQ
jgi:hypothetical protein